MARNWNQNQSPALENLQIDIIRRIHMVYHNEQLLTKRWPPSYRNLNKYHQDT